jgi:hypothetical protein
MVQSELNTLPAERDDLGLHVDLCAIRYLNLERRLQILENKLDKANDDIVKGQKSLGTVVISTGGTVLAALMAAIITILLKF